MSVLDTCVSMFNLLLKNIEFIALYKNLLLLSIVYCCFNWSGRLKHLSST